MPGPRGPDLGDPVAELEDKLICIEIWLWWYPTLEGMEKKDLRTVCAGIDRHRDGVGVEIRDGRVGQTDDAVTALNFPRYLGADRPIHR